MVRSFALSALALLAAAGAAEAACSTKKLAGEWVVQRSATAVCSTRAADCGWACKGRFNRDGRFSAEKCYVITESSVARAPSIGLRLRVSKKCDVHGKAFLEDPRGGDFSKKLFGWVVSGGLRLMERSDGSDFEVERMINGVRVGE